MTNRRHIFLTSLFAIEFDFRQLSDMFTRVVYTIRPRWNSRGLIEDYPDGVDGVDKEMAR